MADNTIHSATNVHNQKTGTTVFDNVHGGGAVLSPVQLSQEQNVDGQFVGSRKQTLQRAHGDTQDMSDQSQERGVDR